MPDPRATRGLTPWRTLVVALAAVLAIFGALLAPAIPSGPIGSINLATGQIAFPRAPADTSALVAAVEPGLVQITTFVDYQGVVGNGAGIVLTPDGQVLTNHHVVQGANSIQAISMATGQTFDADMIGYDRHNDVALLQLRGASGLPVAPLGDSGSVAVGDPVVTIGNANGTGHPFTHEPGNVTQLGRIIDAQDELTGGSNQLGDLIESSTNLRAGDSGGALVNRAGQVIGLNAAATVNFKMGGEGIPGGEGFAIPINKALGIVGQIRSGTPSPGVHIGPSVLLGIGVSSGGSGRMGLPVRSILRGGPADQAGLLPGDTLITIDGVPIDSANALTDVLDTHYAGDIIDLAWITRAGQDRNAKVTLGSGPVS